MLIAPELPLHVFEVLEEEYVSLHGPLDGDDEIWLPNDPAAPERDRLVRARRDWRFHRGHIKSPLTLAYKLLPAPAPRRHAYIGKSPGIPQTIPNPVPVRLRS